MNALAEAIVRGDRRALARVISYVENNRPEGQEVLRDLGSDLRHSHVIGVTGAPGVGKSTLVQSLAEQLSSAGHQVGVLAVDPSSPFSGGALLGDRIRMDHAAEDIFFRSLASRGHLGGLSRTTYECLRLLEAFGKDTVLVETVGAGQSEVEIMSYANTVVVVLVPGMGDEVQDLKAGILEIADVFVVNKADRPGADAVARGIGQLLRLGGRSRTPGWTPPVVRTVASEGKGVAELIAAVVEHYRHLRAADALQAQQRQQAQEVLLQAVMDVLRGSLLGQGDSGWQDVVQEVALRRLTPQDAAEQIVARLTRP